MKPGPHSFPCTCSSPTRRPLETLLLDPATPRTSRLLKEQPGELKTVYLEASRLEYWRASFMKALKVAADDRVFICRKA